MNSISVAVSALAFSLLGLLPGCSGPAGPPAKLTSAQQTEYRMALESMMESDQRHRTALSWGTTDPEELARLEALPDEEVLAEMSRRSQAGIELPADVRADLSARQSQLDAANTQELVGYVERFGWPTEDRVGPYTDPTAILIHMPMDDVGAVLPLLEREVRAGRLEAKRYAAIYDRKRQHDDQPQLYGACRAFDTATGSVLAPAIVDIDQTNAARADIGLEPLTEYRITDAATAAGN